MHKITIAIKYLWQGSKIKLRSFEPDDGNLFFEMISDTKIQRFVFDIRFTMSRKTAFDVAAELSEGFGFVKEGCIRRTIFTKGRYYDELIYVWYDCGRNFQEICSRLCNSM